MQDLTKSPEVFRAFAHPIRLRILNLLLERRELCVFDLCEVLGESQPNVSRHLIQLRRAGLVTVRQVGTWKYHSLTKRTNGFPMCLLGCMSSCLNDCHLLSDDEDRLRKVKCHTPPR
jgi:ArsR family transcriptional regulator